MTAGARARIAEAVEAALDAAYSYSNYRWPQQEDCPRIADALLPVVNQLIADELEAVGDEIAAAVVRPSLDIVRARVAALRTGGQR